MPQTRLRRDVVLSLPGTVVPGLSTFVAFALIAKVADTTLLGLVSLGWVTANFVSAAVALGPAHAAMHDGRVREHQGDRTSQFRMITVRRALFAAALLLVIGAAVTAFGAEIGPVLLVSAPWALGQSLMVFESEVARMEGRFAWVSAASCIRSLVGWALAVLAAVLGGGLAAVVIPTALVGVVVAAWMGGGDLGSVTPEVRRSVSTVGSPVSRSSVLSYGLAYADRYIIQFLLGPAAVGVYTLAYQLGEGAMEIVTAPLYTATLPRVVRDWASPEPERHHRAVSSLRASVLVIAGMCVLVPLGALAFGALGAFDVLVVDPSFAAVTAIVSVAVGAQAITRLGYAVLLARGRTDRSFNAFLVAGLLSLVVVPLMTWQWGLVGAAWASLITYAALAGLTTWSARR